MNRRTKEYVTKPNIRRLRARKYICINDCQRVFYTCLIVQAYEHHLR